MNDWDDARWFKSADSGDHGCVEVAFHGEDILVRDTKDEGSGPVLLFNSHEWMSFLAGAKRGEFDLPQ